ncbi:MULTISPECIES: class I SAM-dependent methyltransferase [unclassified Coleofasciculus]|uniref:class I SAM-dependent methyltransferase n=1 Tax=Cyanophyceae TaxID=3028117 RepID=UPI00168952D0|nr:MULTISPECIES: class I SAM-dependent methyltransferase [unclassified Coleofasciculus]MBD1890683.1 class I SAM-dependent methyltransferase [Coleofasciculus sp. FACHB-SPT9]MBD2541113.1 class I SAM-dependent methyltransferase [Coleofasciculus sp. FACHB-SPT36]
MHKHKQNSGKSTSSNQRQAIRKGYEQYSVQGFYEQFGDEYRNPQESAIQKVLQLAASQWQLDFHKVLDLACGSGEVTLALQSLGCTNIDGIDPYTYNAYLNRTGKEAEPYTFEDIASGILNNRHYSLIVCSFAMHLLPESRLPIVVYQLGLIAHSMIIITPNKRPHLKPEWGWLCLDEIMCNRVRSRLYQRTYGRGE